MKNYHHKTNNLVVKVAMCFLLDINFYTYSGIDNDIMIEN
jgi:hypothetical protein